MKLSEYIAISTLAAQVQDRLDNVDLFDADPTGELESLVESLGEVLIPFKRAQADGLTSQIDAE